MLLQLLLSIQLFDALLSKNLLSLGIIAARVYRNKSPKSLMWAPRHTMHTHLYIYIPYAYVDSWLTLMKWAFIGCDMRLMLEQVIYCVIVVACHSLKSIANGVERKRKAKDQLETNQLIEKQSLIKLPYMYKKYINSVN